jgi:hypothetical protein
MSERKVRTVVEHELIDRIFLSWDTGKHGALSYQVCHVHSFVNLNKRMNAVHCARMSSWD